MFKVETDVGPSYIGMAGTVAHFPVLRKALRLACRARSCKLGTQGRGVRHLHSSCIPYLKDNFFLQHQGRRQRPLRVAASSRVLIANASGIYGLYSYREVFEFKEFWGIGSGRSFALGRDVRRATTSAKTASEVAEAGIAAGCEFDNNSAAPVRRPHGQTERLNDDMALDRSQGARHRRLQGRGGDRGAGQARRHGQGRAVADHRGERQGLDGDSVVARRRGEGAQGQGRRQGQRRARCC